MLLSDGASTKGVDPVAAAQAAAKAQDPHLHRHARHATGTITVPRRQSDPRPGRSPSRSRPTTASLHAIAQASGGKSFTAESADDLSAVYERLGSQLGTKKEPRQITAGFAGAGLALLVLGAALSLRWFGRLI